MEFGASRLEVDCAVFFNCVFSEGTNEEIRAKEFRRRGRSGPRVKQEARICREFEVSTAGR